MARLPADLPPHRGPRSPGPTAGAPLLPSYFALRLAGTYRFLLDKVTAAVRQTWAKPRRDVVMLPRGDAFASLP
jgi:hypothetical protein